jgi:hypothetical protein
MFIRTTLGVALLSCSAMSQADVTLNLQNSGKALFVDLGGESVMQIKGKRQRTDQKIGNKMLATIIDVDGARFVTLDETKKMARVAPFGSINDELAAVGGGAMQVSVTQTAQTKQIAGFACTVHDVRIALPFSATGHKGDAPDVTMVISGDVCLSRDAPGLADYQAFYRAASDAGFIFGDPRQAKTATGAAQSKAYAQLLRKMAEGGIALESHLKISATGEGPLASMMAKLAASDVNTVVTRVTSGELPGEPFDIPAGYKVKEDK